ncbi:MAG TPA: alpha/beta-hydrolase family protein [Pseudolabrys sp.]|nr:alpha/beta-hydrolase family protein [Pseudolabrys sp.]
MKNSARAIRRQVESLCGVGMVLGALFFAASLTPTLVPRSAPAQGALAGTCFAAGYAIGVFLRWLWHYLELPVASSRMRAAANALVAAGSFLVVVSFLWRAAAWQDSIRAVMGLPPVETARPFKVCAIALATFVLLLALVRLFWYVSRFLASRIRRFIPRRIANVVGVLAGILLFWSIADNLLVRTTFRALDSSFRAYDALLEPERPQPTASGKTGSAASLVKWSELGRAGREFVSSAPTGEQISTFTGRPARDPIRVYVGLRGADTPQARARLALAELKRQHGFERSILIIITPTGTGWVDPAAMDSVEYLHDGDVASVAVQYSYLNSPLSLLFEPDYGLAAARALFAEIYGYWTTLPKDKRPKLYVHGLSLGAMNSERSAELFETVGDPISGALWSGPPFESRVWRWFTANRNDNSPYWLPQFRDGRFVRFMNQNGPTGPADAPWGPMRIVYLQYASDPIMLFSYQDAYRAPVWMTPPRGPDVSPDLQWYPIVTMLQIALDMAGATGTPMGYGHVFAPEHYIDAWVAVTDVRNWSPEALARLKKYLGNLARKESGENATGDSPYAGRSG